MVEMTPDLFRPQRLIDARLRPDGNLSGEVRNGDHSAAHDGLGESFVLAQNKTGATDIFAAHFATLLGGFTQIGAATLLDILCQHCPRHGPLTGG